MLRVDAASVAKVPLSRRQAEEEEEEIESDAGEEAEEEEEEEEELYTDEAVPRQRCVPQRPRRETAAHGMAARQRVQRVVVLAGPGQPQVRSRTPSKDVFMTHLPDSPPRGILSRPTIFQFADARLRVLPRSPLSVPSRANDPQIQLEEKDQDEEEVEEEQEEEGAVEPAAEAEEQRPEVDESYEEREDPEDAIEDERDEVSCGGPHAVDILTSSTTPEVHSSEEDEVEEASSSSEDDTEDEEEAEEQAYHELQASRVRIEAEQLERDALREELTSYVASLAVKCDADGERLVAFPRNFQQIVSLMTSRDIASDAPSASKASSAVERDHKSWSQILIQNSLAKQHAFGTLDESEDATDGEGSLAAKIALKMARIRQLDAILEEKLGKNLYVSATTGTTTKKAKRVNPQEPEVVTSTTTRRSASVQGANGPIFSTSRSSESLLVPSQTQQPSTNFIERNRKVVENGAKANLTREEEKRVKRLLRGLKTSTKAENDEETVKEASDPVEFRLEETQQLEIEKLLVDKRGAYPSAVIMALDDVPEDDDQEDHAIATKKGTRVKGNVVQETKRERLRRQRLQRIEEELAFLRDHESVPILPDDDDDTSDGCSSERSFMTTTSMLSAASTRSGVTRRQLDQFVAAEVTKADHGLEDKASREEISKLLRSLSHLPMATARPATTTTV